MIWRMRGENGSPAAAVPRRLFLTAAGAGAVTLLAGCRVRLEDDAPRVPLLPTREPIPDEGLLLQALAQCRDLQALAAAVRGHGTSVAARVGRLHARQVSVLEQVLRSARVPERSYAASPTPTIPTPTPSSGRPVPTGTTLAAQEVLAVRRPALTALAGASTVHLSLLSAVTVQRAVAATQLGGAVAWPPSTVAPRAAAPDLLAAVRSVVYGFEVVAAQSSGEQRARAVAVLTTLRVRSAQLEVLAGRDAPAPPLGYDLPFPVTTPAAAARLARTLLPALLLSVGSAFAAAAHDQAALTGLLRWAAQTQAQGVSWGAALTAFPGLAAS
jgi:hypothetical protein